MRKILTILLLTLLTISLTPFQLFASTQDNIEGLSYKAQQIYNGNKLSLEQTLSNSSDVIEGRYVIFTKEFTDTKSVMEKFSNDIQITTEIPRIYGKSQAFSIALEDTNNKKTLEEIHSQKDVLAIIPVKRMETLAVNSPNDPRFPISNSYSSTNQWYLNQPGNGYYGIDILRAWDAMDGSIDSTVDYSDPQNYGGTSDVLVAVIDTGVAFEDYDDDGDGLKYDEFSNMTTPTGWDFDKSPDMTDLIYTNATETDFNQADETIGDTHRFCLDINADGQCITGDGDKPGRYFDDRHGVNFTDYIWYWVSDNYSSGETTGITCTNEPYKSERYECVTDRYCNNTGLENTNYYGCYESEMGHPNDTDGHGTAVTNVIAGKVNNSTSGTGISPGITILPIQVFGYQHLGSTWKSHEYSGSTDIIAEAVNYAVDAGADVINLSLGGGASLDMELAIYNAYYNHDIVVIAASGNSYGTSYIYPASYDSVISVGASKQNGSRAVYSTYNDQVEIAAPVEDGGIPIETYACFFTHENEGGESHSCMGDDTQPDIDPSDPSFPPDLFSSTQFAIGNIAGTSFSSPQVAAVAGLLRSKYPSWDAEKVRRILGMTVTAYPSSRSTSAGYGILNAYNAVRGVNSMGADITSDFNIIQTVQGTNSKLYTRYSKDDGITWSSWVGSIYVMEAAESIEVGSNIIQTVRGTDYKIYTRYSTNNGITWSSWQGEGHTYSKVGMVYSGTNVLQTVRGTDNKIYIRYSTNDGVSWSSWKGEGYTYHDIGMVATDTHVLQTVRGTDNKIYIRYSTNDGISWSAWKGEGYTYGTISMVATDTQVIQTVRGTDRKIYVRYSTNDGISWSSWRGEGYTNYNIGMITTNTHVIQTVRGTDNKIYTRYSANDGVSWSSWSGAGYTYNDIEMMDAGSGHVIQSVKGTDGKIYTRNSTNNASTWSAWKGEGYTYGTSELLYNSTSYRGFQSVRGTDDGIYTRVSNTRGATWSGWIKSGYTIAQPTMFVADN